MLSTGYPVINTATSRPNAINNIGAIFIIIFGRFIGRPLYFASAEAKALDAMKAPTPVSIALAPNVFDLPIARGATLKSIARIPTSNGTIKIL